MKTGLWQEIASKNVGRVPTPLPRFVWTELYTKFAAFSDYVAARPAYGDLFNRTAKQWQFDSGFSMHFGGYFSPYFRNRVGGQAQSPSSGESIGAKVPKNVNKVIVQFCEPYYRYLARQHPELLSIGPFRELIEGLSCALFSAYGLYREVVAELASVDRALAESLLSSTILPPVTIRLIRYVPDARYFADPHVDKSALTIIMDTDELPDQPCLVFAPPNQAKPCLSAFQPVQRAKDESLAFFGAAPGQAGFDVRPAIHAARPQQSTSARHVAIFSWLLPGTDMSRFETTASFVDDLNRSRRDLANEPAPKTDVMEDEPIMN